MINIYGYEPTQFHVIKANGNDKHDALQICVMVLRNASHLYD